MTIRRPRLERWLEAYRQTPLRLLVAPSGFGKTSLLVTYASESAGDVAYCALPPDCDVPTLRGEIVRALSAGKVPRSYDAFLSLINGSPAHCREIVVDDADNATPEAIAELLALADGVAQNVTLIYAARSRERMDARRVTARGIAVACGPRLLAFDAQETAQFAGACGVQTADLDVRRLVEETDGWAIPLCGAVRVAAAECLTLLDAYERWRSDSAAFLHELLQAELARVSESDRAYFLSLMDGKPAADRNRLYELESRGLFIFDDGAGQLRLYRPLSAPHIGNGMQEGDLQSTLPMMVRMFRDFEATIGGKAIPWVRRRDQQIVKYLLLKPDGRATRAELVDVFWNGTDRHLAIQSVRTACSTIRKAIAAVVGHSEVERYFRTVPELRIDLANVVCDVRRFAMHADDGDAAYAAADLQSAGMHYRAAEKLYSGRLLEFEASEPWFEAQARRMHERYASIAQRAAEIALASNERRDAQQLALRARAAAPDSADAAMLVARVAAPVQTRRRMNNAYVESV